MWIQTIVHEACPICGKETTLAGWMRFDHGNEMELHTYRCVDCGPVKTTDTGAHARPRPCPPGSPSTQAMRSARTPLVDCGGLGLYSGEKPVDIGRSLHSPAFVQGGVNQQSGKLEAKDVKMHEVPLQEDGIWTPLPGLWPHDACPH